MRWKRESVATHTVDFINADGTNITLAGPPTAVILDPVAATFVEGVGVLGAGGVYSFSWAVPSDALLGLWKIEWTAIGPAAVELTGEEWFEIVEAGSSVLSEDIALLRSYVGDRRLSGIEENDLFFTDDELHTLLVKNASDLDAATMEGWFIKMAQYGELVDHVESGAEQRMRQKFINAKAIYDSLVKKAEERSKSSATAIGIVGKAMNLRKDPHDPLGRGYFWGNPSSTATYVRTYPLYRFPAILA